MRKFGARVLVVALLSFTTVGLTATAGATSAMACGSAEAHATADDSREFAASLPQLNPGDRGPEVRGMQIRLAKLGYGLSGTGLYADNTLAAVKDFQRKHSINDSGTVGSKTWQKLLGGLPSRATTPPRTTYHQLLPGAHDPSGMTDLSYTIIRIPNLGELPEWGDTVYHEGWQSPVRSFQRSMGITDSGIVGAKTWAALTRTVSVAGNWGC